MLRNLSGHSADYILFGLDDSVIDKTKEYLDTYDEYELAEALNILRNLSQILRK